MFPVRYELNFYIYIKRISDFIELILIGKYMTFSGCCEFTRK
jgi:hypothetical protein